MPYDYNDTGNAMENQDASVQPDKILHDLSQIVFWPGRIQYLKQSNILQFQKLFHILMLDFDSREAECRIYPRLQDDPAAVQKLVDPVDQLLMLSVDQLVSCY